MFLLQDPGGEGVFVVNIEYRDCLLQNDSAVVEFFVHEMDRAARNLHTVSKSLFLGLKSGKSRQQRRMNVKNAPGKLLHKPRREQPHISRKTDQINFVFLQSSYYLTIMLGTIFGSGWNHQRGEPEPAGSLNTTCILSIGNNDGDACIGNTPSRDILGDGLEVRTASGEQDAEILH